MRVLVTGAGGPIGKRVIQTFMDNISSDLEFILAVDSELTQPWFIPDDKKIWVSKDLNTIDDDWWETTVNSNQIDKIIYLESSENYNMYNLDNTSMDILNDSDNGFVSYLKSIVILPESSKVQVIYMSTDRVYSKDEYPDEMDEIILPVFNADQSNNTYQSNRYALIKLGYELEMQVLDTISLRIIRPFSIVSSEQGTDFPLSYIVLSAIRETDLYTYLNGDRGLTFTYSSDLANFLTKDIFDESLSSTLSSNIINFSRTRNYLPEEYLIEKIKNKISSNSIINYGTDVDNFEFVQRTPRTENSDIFYNPQVTIESIIEELLHDVDPVDKYAPVEITSSTYDINKILTITGTSEPFATISIQLGSGDTLVADADLNGYWVTTSEEAIDYNEIMDGHAYGTTPEKVQYSTVAFFIEP